MISGVGNDLRGGLSLFMRSMGGPYLSSISGVEIARWDLAGKAMNVPVYRCWAVVFGKRSPSILTLPAPMRQRVLPHGQSQSAKNLLKLVPSFG